MKQFIHWTTYEKIKSVKGFPDGTKFRRVVSAGTNDLGTAESLLTSERYPPVIFFCHLALEKALKALYVEKFSDNPDKTHSLVFLVEILELELPQKFMDSLFVINRIGITGRYPHNLDVVLEQYTKEKTEKILRETQEILAWLTQKSLKR